MVEDPTGDSTDAPDGDDLHLEPVTVEGVGTVLVLDVRGRLAEVAEPAYLSVLLGLAEEPAAVLCDVSGVTGPVDHESVALLASLGAEVEQWPGVPIAVVCPDPQLREALAARPDSRHLVVEPEREPVLARLLAGRPASMVRMSLEPHPRSAGAARELVAQACDRWGMSSITASATLVVSELVTNALPHAGSNVGLSVARCGRRLRVAVRDASSERPQPQPVELSRPRGRGLLLVAAVADAWGVLPAGDGGKVVWAVLHD
jgi:anti-sigma regulatory factor (Ser/Thr protein kinase)